MKRILWTLTIAFAVLVVGCLIKNTIENIQYFGQVSFDRLAIGTGWNSLADALEHIESPLGVIVVILLVGMAGFLKTKPPQ